MNFLITEYCGLGNSILLSSLFKSLNQEKNNIIFIGDNKFSGLTANDNNIYIKETFYLKNLSLKKLFDIIKILRKTDVLLIPLHSNPSLLFFLLSIIFLKKEFIISNLAFKNMNFMKKIIIKFLIYFKNLSVTKVTHSPEMHEIEINHHFLKFVKNKSFKLPSVEKFDYFNFPKNERCLKKFDLPPKSYIVLQLFSANGIIISKNWPLNNFKKLSELLIKKYPNKLIVLIGDDGDKRHLNQEFNNPKIRNLIAKTTISELIEILKNSSFIICHDSSILHLSDSMKLKNLSLFGQSNYIKNKPYNSKSMTIKKDKMDDIKLVEVMDSIEKNM